MVGRTGGYSTVYSARRRFGGTVEHGWCNFVTPICVLQHYRGFFHVSQQRNELGPLSVKSFSILSLSRETAKIVRIV